MQTNKQNIEQQKAERWEIFKKDILSVFEEVEKEAKQ